MCSASFTTLKHNECIRPEMIQRLFFGSKTVISVRFCSVKILGEMRTAAVFRCLARLGGNSVQTGVVWGAMRTGGGYDWTPTLPNAKKKRKKEKKIEVSLMLSLNSRRGENQTKRVG